MLATMLQYCWQGFFVLIIGATGLEIYALGLVSGRLGNMPRHKVSKVNYAVIILIVAGYLIDIVAEHQWPPSLRWELVGLVTLAVGFVGMGILLGIALAKRKSIRGVSLNNREIRLITICRWLWIAALILGLAALSIQVIFIVQFLLSRG
ncbi:hypothetical protein FC34_GL000118 [Lacticaseibacillus brantae DSM 23927]|uniref:Uncharacterized protein n=2 Tax=Lacticaseibacillus brantae TaxID=943673 RepID=A0A0R2AZM4_9LACO|nr:hypothetical protein FC34_GL000118 [Lacticaseibacillus brantae DSM 23927]